MSKVEKAPAESAVNGMGAKVLRILAALGEKPLLYLADDETEAEGLASVLAAMLPDVPIVHVPASDTLPGEDAPASPANIGHRVTALRRLRAISQDDTAIRPIVVASGEAAAHR